MFINTLYGGIYIFFLLNRYFQYFFDGLTVVNALVIGLSSDDSSWDVPLEWTFLSCFLAEIVLKLLTLGPKRFFRRAWNA